MSAPAVTIYTDASIYRGVGAWGTVIIRGDDRREHAGRLRGRFESSTAVEAAAMANALHKAASLGFLAAGEMVEVHCDNKHVVERIAAMQADRPWRDARDETTMRAVAYVLSTAATLRVDLCVRWVKGHQRLDSRDPHALHNRRCDQLCGAARKGVKPPSWPMLQEQHAAFQRRRDRREAHAARTGKVAA